MEHPEDLGRMHRGEPASIWQLPEIRLAFGEFPYATVAGHQCQFPGVDRAKPTRLLSDILEVTDFVGDSDLEKEALRVMKEFAWEHDMPLSGKIYERLRSR